MSPVVVVLAIACASDATAIPGEAPVAVIDAPSRDTTVVLGEGVVFAGSASDPDGEVVTHLWDFGDGGSASVEDPGTHTYGSVGSYDVRYQVTDDAGTSSPVATRTVTVVAPGNRPPVARIDSPSRDTTVVLGDEVVFAGSASDPDGEVVTHSWDFGDDSTSAAEDPGAYTYGSTGSHEVRYRVTDDDGAPSPSSTRTVTVIAPGNQIPVASIDSPSRDTTVVLGEEVVFAASASDPDGEVVTHSWDFDDGGSSAVEDPGAYTYAASGIYDVTYRVVDDGGAPSTAATRRVTVVTASSNHALRFHGNGTNDEDRVKIRIGDDSNVEGPPVNVGASDFTIEFWVRGDTSDNTGNIGASQCNNAFEGWIEGNIIIDRDRNNLARDYGVSFTDGFVAFGVGGPSGGYYTICGDILVLDDSWHHVALTRDESSGQLCAYVDGVQDVCRSGPSGDISYPAGASGGALNDPFIVLGAEKHDADPGSFPPFDGFMDELRFSDTLRYTSASFTLPSSRFTTDQWTVGLYHFDEGAGSTLGDSSGVSVDPHWGDQDGVLSVGGSPPGPEWVVSGAPTGN